MHDMPWYIPIVVCLARIGDVSLGTIRTISVFNGQRAMAATLGAAEVTIWVFAVAGVIQYLPNPFAVLGYATGFAMGVLVGMSIEDRIALGYRLVRIISTSPDSNLSTVLRQHGFGVTRLEATGRDGPVEMTFLAIRRRSLKPLNRLIRQVAPEAFVTVERVDRLIGGVIPHGRTGVREWASMMWKGK